MVVVGGGGGGGGWWLKVILVFYFGPNLILWNKDLDLDQAEQLTQSDHRGLRKRPKCEK